MRRDFFYICWSELKILLTRAKLETSLGNSLIQFNTIDGERELVANVLGGVLRDERSRIHIELIDGMDDDLSGIPGEFNK